jgi:hypothetical protein
MELAVPIFMTMNEHCTPFHLLKQRSKDNVNLLFIEGRMRRWAYGTPMKKASQLTCLFRGLPTT